MRLHRRPVRWLSAWLVGLLLCAQWATAAYACPRMAAPAPGSVAMGDCPGHMGAAADPGQPQLCKAHCQQGSQSVDSATPAHAAAATAPLLLAVLDWSAAWHVPAAPPGRRTAFLAGASPPGDPPLYLRLLVLRN